MTRDPKRRARRHGEEIMAMPPELRRMVAPAMIECHLALITSTTAECRAMMAELDAAEAKLLPDERAAAAAELAELRGLIRQLRARVGRSKAKVRRIAAQYPQHRRSP